MGKAKHTKVKMIAALIVVAAAVIGFFIYRNTMILNNRLNSIAETLLNSSEDSQRDDVIFLYDRNYSKFYKYKDSKKLAKVLGEIINERIAEFKEEHPASTLYDSPLDKELAEAVVRFDEIGLHDEDLDKVMTDFLKAEKDEAIGDYEHARVVSDLALYIKSANSDFYLKNVFADGELADYFSGCVSHGIETRDAYNISLGLATAHALGITEQCFPDQEALYRELIDSYEVYATSDINGSFFSKGTPYSKLESGKYGAEGMQAIGRYSTSTSETPYGDFGVRVNEEYSHVDGLVDEGSKADFNYNRKSKAFIYLRGYRASNITESLLNDRSINYIVGGIDEDMHIFSGIFAIGDGKIIPCMDSLVDPSELEFYDLSKYLKDNSQDTNDDASTRIGRYRSDWKEIAKDENIPSNSGMEYINTVYNTGINGDYSDLASQAQERFNETTNCETIINSAFSELKDGDSEKAEESLTIFLENAGWQEYLKDRAIALISEGDPDTALKISDMLDEHGAKPELTNEILSAYENSQTAPAGADSGAADDNSQSQNGNETN